MNKNIIKGYIFVIISAVLYGLMPLMAKYIYNDGVTSLSLVFLRNFLTVPCIFVIAKISGISLRVNRKLIPVICLIGILGSCVTAFLLYSSYNYIPSGAATVLHFVYPAAVVVGEYFVFKHKIHYGHIISVIMCIVGIALFYNPEGNLNASGSILAILSGITYASYIVFLSAFKHKDIPVLTFNFYVSAASAVIMLPACLFTGGVTFPVSVTGWFWAFMFAFVLGCGAVIWFQKGTFIIGGSRAAIISTLEPITSVIAGVLLLGEPLSALTFVGVVLVLAAGVIIAVCDAKKG